MAVSSEFSIIHRYFENLTTSRDDVLLGIGDDCALLTCPPDHHLAVSIDTLVEGVHFFADVDPQNLGYKSLAVGLSDLAAMGAKPAWFTLALTLPDCNDDWLSSFATGLAELAQHHDIQLVGGDTTRGPLTISIQVHGFVPEGKALRRDSAQVGDKVFVTGTLGDAGVGLALLQGSDSFPQVSDADKTFLRQRLERPTPRNDISEVILSLATSAIDISDGLLADLGHIVAKSGVAASIDLNRLPLSNAMQGLTTQKAQHYALSSGDDYELCFTVPENKVSLLKTELGNMCTEIGQIEQGQDIHCYRNGQKITHTTKGGYDHFSE